MPQHPAPESAAPSESSLLFVGSVGVFAALAAVVLVVAATSVGGPELRELRAWAFLAIGTSIIAALQLWRRTPRPGFLLIAIGVGALPATALSNGGEFPAFMAAIAVLATVVLLIDRKNDRQKLGLFAIFAATTAGTVLHAYVIEQQHGHDGLHSPLGIVIGTVILAVALTLSYTLIARSVRQAAYDEGLHRTLFEASADGIVIVDESGTVVGVNPAGESIFGAAPGHLTGRPLSELVPADKRTGHEAGRAAFMQAPEARAMTEPQIVEAVRSWGEPFPIELSVSTVQIGDRRLAAAHVRDITHRLQVEEAARISRERYRNLYEGAPFALYSSTPHGELLDVNPAFAALIGAESVQEAMRAKTGDLYADQGERDRVVEAIASGSGRIAFRLRRLDGQVLWVRIHSRAIQDEAGRSVSFEGAIENIDAEVESEQALQTSLEGKQRLIAAVGHSLRTPMTVILGYAALLADHASTDDDPTEVALLIQDQAHEMSMLVDEIMLASSLQDAKGVSVVCGPVPLEAPIARAVEALRWPRDVPDVVIASDAPIVTGDGLRIEQVIRTILWDGLRHGWQDHAIDFDQQGDKVLVTVSSKGTPIPDGERHAAFEPFAASDPGASEAGRLSTGLWSARRLARLMEGDLSYTHRDGRNRYVIELPGRAEAAGADEQTASAA